MSKFGTYVKFTTKPGMRDDLADILLEAAAAAQSDPDCELYIVNVTDAEPDTLWVTEIWSSEEAQQAALALEETKASIRRAMPLIAGAESVKLRPLGGKGLPSAAL